MTKTTLTSMAFAAGCAIALIVPAVHAQTTGTQVMRTASPLDKCGSDKDRRLLRDSQLRASCFERFLSPQDQRPQNWNEGLTGDSSGMMNSRGSNPYDPNTPVSNAGE